MIKPILLLFLAFILCANLSFGHERSDSLTRKEIVDLAVEKIVKQDEQNTINELNGKGYANNYIINIDTTNWIEEQGASTKILNTADFNTISSSLKKFNTRKDKLRFYVIVINDYVVSFQMPIDPQLVTGSFKWNDLANYPAQQTTVKLIRSNTSTLINNINEALKNKGFTDRIIYFYSKLKVEEYDLPRYYIYDHLGFYGSSIEPIQDDIKSHIKTFQKDAVTNITQAVSSIINSVELVQSGDVTAPVVDCTQSILVIAANTKAIRDKEYNAAITSFVQLVDNPSTAQQKGSRYLVVDQPEKLANDDSFFKAVLPDKLSLLAQPGTSDYKLYVVFKEINFVLPTSEWAAFASAIANKSTIAKQANTILMVVPYFHALCTGLNGLGMPINKGTGILMPAVITSGTVIQSQMNAALNAQGTSWETNFNQAYSKIPKKHYQYIYAVNYQFYVVDKKTIVTNNATDNKNIYDLNILVDKRLSAHIALLLKRKDESLAYGGPASVQQVLDDLAALKNEEPSFYRLEHGLKESSMVPTTLNGRTFSEIGDQYILWFVQKKLQESQVWPEAIFDFNTQQHNAPALGHFQKGYNVQTIEEEFDKLDKAGLALAPFDLDWITDGAGFMLACKYEDSQKKIIYGAAVGAPIVAAYFWRKGAKYFRKADGSFQVAEEIADDAMTLWFKVKSKLKDNLNWTDDVIEQFGKDFGGDAEILAKFDQDPGLVDAWKKLDGAGLTALRKDPIQLQKFDDIVKSNNLGLDTDGLGDLLKAPTTKIDAATGLPLKWDNPDKVLDAVKSTSDANVPGVSIDHKKFPAPANGTDNFVLKNAKQFQAEASGDAALSFNKGGVSFDNVAADGKLVDRKYGHGSSIFDKSGDELAPVYDVLNNSRAEGLMEQAQRQLNAVGGDGSKIRWEISTETGAGGIEQLFFNNRTRFPGIENIEIVHVPQQTIIP